MKLSILEMVSPPYQGLDPHLTKFRIQSIQKSIDMVFFDELFKIAASSRFLSFKIGSDQVLDIYFAVGLHAL